jgi:outer membrane protein assembly factor BamB
MIKKLRNSGIGFGLWALGFGLLACAKNDPILPGERAAIFPVAAPEVQNTNVPDEYLTAMYEQKEEPVVAEFVQDSHNTIWQITDSGDRRRIFSGIPTTSKLNLKRAPVYSKGFVFAGLSTGEVVKINPKNRDIKWIQDVFLEISVTGGNPVLDITTVSVVDGAVYAGGLGGQFCKLDESGGKKIWCEKISPAAQALVSKNLIFVVSSGLNLYALDASKGTIYWKAEIKNWGHEFKLIKRSDQFLLLFPNGKVDAKTGKIIR